MIYDSFVIENFKGIDNVEITLRDNHLISLVGLNESGKTTIMDAILLFYQMIKGDEPEDEQLKSFRPKGISFTGDITIKGSLRLEEEDIRRISSFWISKMRKRGKLIIPELFTYTYKFNYDLHSYKTTSKHCEFNVTRESGKPVKESNKHDWQSLIDFIKEEIIPVILYFDDFIFQIPDRISFMKTGHPIEDDVKKKNNKVWQLVLNDILKSVDRRMTFQEHVVDIYDSDKDAAINRLSQMEKALDEKITNRWKLLFGKEIVNFSEIKLESEYYGAKYYLSFKIRSPEKQEFMVKERSKGFKWFFSFLLFTEFRKKRTKNILFLLDEPASNLHSSAQAKILDALGELSKDSQVIYSTHSHHLINPIWLKGAYICINEHLSAEMLEGDLNLIEGAKITAEKYFTYVGKGHGSDKLSYYQPILDRLDYQPSAVEPIPKIVILEGRNDWYTYRYLEEIILKKSEKMNFYPGGGKDKLHDIIRLYLSWGKSFLVLLDGDSGVKSKDRYLKEYGDYVKDRVFTLRDVINKPVPLEGLFGVMDKRNICDQVFGKGTYDRLSSNSKKLKECFNQALVQLLIKGGEVKIGKTAINHFTRIFRFIESQFSIIEN